MVRRDINHDVKRFFPFTIRRLLRLGLENIQTIESENDEGVGLSWINDAGDASRSYIGRKEN